MSFFICFLWHPNLRNKAHSNSGRPDSYEVLQYLPKSLAHFICSPRQLSLQIFFWMNTNFYRYFSENPKPMFDLIKELYLDHNPTLTHYFIALLEKKGLLLRVYTQNVDSLGSTLSKISSFFLLFSCSLLFIWIVFQIGDFYLIRSVFQIYLFTVI